MGGQDSLKCPVLSCPALCCQQLFHCSRREQWQLPVLRYLRVLWGVAVSRNFLSVSSYWRSLAMKDWLSMSMLGLDLW